VHQVLTILGFPKNSEIFLVFQSHFDAVPEDFMVIGDRYTDLLSSHSLGSEII
jgi:hypothetical protein